MITVSELLQVNLLDKFKLITEKKGLEKTLSNVVILEYESILGNYNDFNAGDFVLTSLFFAKEDSSLIKTAFENIIKRDISGIAIKTVYFSDIPNDIKKLANDNNIPIFLFDNIYIEDIIINVNDFVKNHDHYDFIEKKIEKLLSYNYSKHEVLNISRELFSKFHNSLACAYFENSSDIGNTQIYREFNKLKYRKSHLPNLSNCLLLKYKKGIFLIYQNEKVIQNSCSLKDLNFSLNSLLINKDQYKIGLCNNYHILEEFDVCIKKSLYAFKIGSYYNKQIFSYNLINQNNFILTLLENKISYMHYQNTIDILINYDKRYKSNLIDTLLIYVETNGNIKETANKLFQHQNTIRYRINKIKSLLSIDNDNLFFAQSHIIISMYKLNKFLN
ncbi:MAG: PucR family transcriptional regulator [Clostridiales bacterium]